MVGCCVGVLLFTSFDRFLRRTTRNSLPGSKGAPPPRPDSVPGLEMRARGAQAKRIPSQSTVLS